MNDDLEDIQKSLDDYLERKRYAFKNRAPELVRMPRGAITLFFSTAFAGRSFHVFTLCPMLTCSKYWGMLRIRIECKDTSKNAFKASEILN